jgi:hypothetical protein
MFKYKITESDITHGPQDPDEFEATVFAHDLMKKGYRRISNAYCRISRIDREDWVDVMAKERHCSRADFYNVNGSGIGDHHRDFYIRTYSEDKLIVHPKIFRKIKGY